MTHPEETIIALATANGPGAIAVIRLSGPEAISVAGSVFGGKNLVDQASHTVHFGKIKDGDLILDEVLVSIFRSPRSYTREDVVEICCHGSIYVAESIIKLLIRKGARAAKPGEFTLRAFMNGQLDLSQAEAVADLIASDSKASQQAALNQLRGGFSSQLQDLRQQLVDFASLIELELDFSEEDVEFANRKQFRDLVSKILKVSQVLIQSFDLGNAIKQGVNTVIAGRPNAGKSTLLNALLNEDRAIVSPVPGTTRDTIEEVLNINGINFRLTDTAGLREATDVVEQIGVAKTLEKISQTAVLLYVYDAGELSPDALQEDISRLAEPNIPFIAVANKTDLMPQPHKLPISLPKGLAYINISAKEKQGIEGLKQLLYDQTVGGRATGDETLITNIRHLEALQKTAEALTRVLKSLDSSVSSDLLAFDMKQALHYLGEITGAVTTDDLLGNIFSKFCIGK